MKILAVDSSSVTAGAAICDSGRVVAEAFVNAGLTHSQTLMPMIDSLFGNTGFSIKDIDAFAVTAGPGSFTGVRIGISAVKGMAFALNKPCVPVSSLRALSLNVAREGEIVCSCIDAGRAGVYNAMFECSASGDVVGLSEDRVITADDLAREIKKYGKNINFVGDGAQMCYNIAKSVSSSINLRLVPERIRFIRASCVASAAEILYSRGSYTNASGLIPIYLRRPKAERELAERTAESVNGR